MIHPKEWTWQQAVGVALFVWIIIPVYLLVIAVGLAAYSFHKAMEVLGFCFERTDEDGKGTGYFTYY